ncbi:MAG: LysR family transcriptional regulator [Burkholderiales bacterium]|nr:LysR family transcriptional regulator [Burkholderiales bacterium]
MPQSNIHRYLRHGTLPQLCMFEASARLGSFTRAAQELHLAQPTASVQIRKLSETVGLPLFEQVGKRIYLTEAGRRLRASCTELFRTLTDLEDTLAGMRGLACGRLQLAVSTAAKYFAPRMLTEFIRRHPGMEVTLQIHNHQALTERLAANEDDLYIFADPPVGEAYVAQTILPNPLVVFARADHPLAKEKNIAFARLAQEPFLMREPGSGTRLAAEAAFTRHRLKPLVSMELGSNEAITQAILAGFGVSILSRYTLGLDTAQAQLTCLEVEGFPLERHWQFVYPTGKQLSQPAQGFMDLVRVEARQLLLQHLAQGPQPAPLKRKGPELVSSRLRSAA